MLYNATVTYVDLTLKIHSTSTFISETIKVLQIQLSLILHGFTVYFIYKLRTQCHTIIADTVQNNNKHTFFNFYLFSAPHKFSCLLTGKPTSVIPTTTTTNVRGVAECVGRLYYKAKQFVRVWRHEITRVIFDRLISEEDHAIVKGHLVRLLSANYEKNIDYVMRDPILYGDYINTLEPAEPRLYECIQDFPTAQV